MKLPDIESFELVNNQSRLEKNHVRDHGIVNRVGVFGDVEIFLDDTTRVGEFSKATGGVKLPQVTVPTNPPLAVQSQTSQ